MQELTSIFTLSSLALANSGTLFLCLLFCLLWLKLFQKRSVKTPLMLNWTSTPCFYFSYCPLYRALWPAEFFKTYFCLSVALLMYKKIHVDITTYSPWRTCGKTWLGHDLSQELMAVKPDSLRNNNNKQCHLKYLSSLYLMHSIPMAGTTKLTEMCFI